MTDGYKAARYLRLFSAFCAVLAVIAFVSLLAGGFDPSRIYVAAFCTATASYLLVLARACEIVQDLRGALTAKYALMREVHDPRGGQQFRLAAGDTLNVQFTEGRQLSIMTVDAATLVVQ